MEKLTKQREYTVILIWCQALLFNLEFYLVLDFVSLCRSIKFNLYMFKAGGRGSRSPKNASYQAKLGILYKRLTNNLRFKPTFEKTVWISDFLLNMQVCLSKNYIKIEEKYGFF